MLEQQTIAVMQTLSNEIRNFSNNFGPYLTEVRPILEINALSQVCSNLQLSEEVRSIAAARLETLIINTYGQRYSNNSAKQFK